MPTRSNIFLIGPMGVGKTTIGRQLAERLDLRFFDSDHEIEQRTGADIPWIFDVEGEAGFRRREQEVIDELTAQPGVVLATGGGAVLDPQNRTRLRDRGTVIYLKAPLESLLERTARDRKRPLLRTANPRARLARIMAEREPLYREAADFVVSTDRRPVRQVVREIVDYLRRSD